MLFFARCVVYICGFLPKQPNQARFSAHVRLVLGYHDCVQKVAAWHRSELEKLDPLYRLLQERLALGAAYDKAESEGISPMDPRYPSSFGFSEIDWEEEARVHSSILGNFKETGAERMRRLDEALREYPQERVDAVTRACVSALKPKDSG